MEAREGDTSKGVKVAESGWKQEVESSEKSTEKSRRSSSKSAAKQAPSPETSPADVPPSPEAKAPDTAPPSADRGSGDKPPEAAPKAPAKRRASQATAAGATGGGPPEVRCPVALDETTPSTSDFVLLRPLPYDPVPPDAGDTNKQRTFIYKGALLVVPMLPLQSPREGSPKSEKQSEDVRQNKGWKMVKSKVVGAAVKVE